MASSRRARAVPPVRRRASKSKKRNIRLRLVTMRQEKLLCVALIPSLLVSLSSSARDHDEEEGQARVLPSFFFPFFRQYQDIDLGDNLNRLKSSDTVAFFIIRDTMTVRNDLSFEAA